VATPGRTTLVPQDTAAPAPQVQQQGPIVGADRSAQAQVQVAQPAQTTTTAVTLTGSVGDHGANAPADVTAVQGRLVALGYLAQAAATAEAPQGTQPVAATAMPQTITGISKFARATLGQPLTILQPNQMSGQSLNTAPAYAAGTSHLTGTVGASGANAVADVRTVQARLVVLSFLTQAQATAEQPAAGATGAVADAQLQQTIAGIRRFQREVNASTVAQIRPADEDALNHPPQIRTARVDLTTSVGAGGANQPPSVRAVQDRLHTLGYLSDASFTAEQVDPATQGAVADARLAQTIAAIRSMQTTLGQGRITVDGKIEPGSVTHRLLMNPSLPVPQDMSAMTAAVGADTVARRGHPAAPAPNHAADVTLVQGRMRELGFLSVADALAERPAAGAAGMTAATLPQTIAAIRAYQQRVVGTPPDGRIEAGGLSQRLMADPTYGTMTTVNPNADNPNAGPAATSYTGEVQAIIAACEQIESGHGGGGERPAVLHNGSGTPASFGKAQLIGGTAVGTLRANQSIADSAGLSRQDLTDLNTIATNTANRYDAIVGQVPHHGWQSDSDVTGHAGTYTSANGVQFHRDTGLYDTDITQMFRTGQFIRQALDFTSANAADMLDATAHPASATNIAALGLNAHDVATFVANPRFRGEHKQGFVTRALFNSEHGQQLRDAMTDNGGAGPGRALINDNFNQVVRRAAQLGVTLTVTQRAQITALMHNAGGGGLDGYINNPAGAAANPYVVQFDHAYHAPAAQPAATP
jgi:hypothetical protein